MSGLIIGLIGNNGLKYVLIFGIGSYIVFIIYVISIICKWEMEIVWISGGVILGICTIVGLIIGYIMNNNNNLMLLAVIFIIIICPFVFVIQLCCQHICN